MNSEHFDAIVMGTGGVGSAAFYQLAKRAKTTQGNGCRILGLDRHPPGHDRGSSHGSTRVIRQAYFEHADYVPLALAAYDLWAELEQTVKSQLFWETGLLQVGPTSGEVVSGVVAAAQQHHLTIEQFSAAEAVQRYPQFQIPSGFDRTELSAVFEPAAGFLQVEDCVRAHVTAAEGCGGIWKQEAATGWQVDGDTVTVTTAVGSYSTERLIITTGSWARTALPRLHDQLVVLAKHLHWYAASPSMSLESGCPVYLFETETGIFYGFPSTDGHTAKIAEHSGGILVETDVEAFERTIDEIDRDRIKEFAVDWVPAISQPTDRFEVCFYTMSPDDHFILGQHPDFEQVFLAAGLSGHGFKFTPVLGQALAELAMDGSTNLPIQFLSPSRL